MEQETRGYPKYDFILPRIVRESAVTRTNIDVLAFFFFFLLFLFLGFVCALNGRGVVSEETFSLKLVQGFEPQPGCRFTKFHYYLFIIVTGPAALSSF